MLNPDIILIARVLFLLLLANGTPIIAKKLLGERWAYPLDGGKLLGDGKPWFGSAKTFRGFISAVIVTSIAGSIMGYSFITGALFAIASLCGDLVSSFIKRRLGLLPGSRALGLDQLPESIFPLVVCWQVLGINMPTAVIVVILFFILELALSRFLFRLHIRDHPY